MECAAGNNTASDTLVSGSVGGNAALFLRKFRGSAGPDFNEGTQKQILLLILILIFIRIGILILIVILILILILIVI